MEFKTIRGNITNKDIELAKSLCEENNINVKDHDIRLSCSQNIVVYKGLKTIFVVSRDGEILAGRIENYSAGVFTLGRIQKIKKEIGEIINDFYDVSYSIEDDKLIICGTSKVPFLKDFKHNYVKGYPIYAEFTYKCPKLNIKEEYEEFLTNKDKMLIEIAKRNSAFLEFYNNTIYFKINGYRTTYYSLFTKKNSIKSEPFNKLKEKVKLYPSYKNFKNDCLERKIQIRSRNKNISTIFYKNGIIEVDFTKAYKRILNEFTNKIDKREKKEQDALISSLSDKDIYGDLIALSICEIILSDVHATNSGIVKILRGLSLSRQMGEYCQSKLKKNYSKFNKIPSEYIEKTIKELNSNNLLRTRRMSGDYGNFTINEPTEKTRLFVDFIKNNDFPENELTIIKKIKEEPDKIKIINQLISHPACYFFSSDIQEKLYSIDTKIKKYIKTMCKLEDDAVKKKLLKEIEKNAK